MEKIVIELKKEQIASKKSGEVLNCVNVDIYGEERPDENINYIDFKVKIPFNTKNSINIEEIEKDTFNRYILNGYTVPNAYCYGIKLILERIKERKENKQ